jgi:uncharacterized protein
MAINATPEYEKAEDRYRSASTPAEQLEALQEMLRLVPKHKASEKAQSEIKRKISALRKDMAAHVGKAAVHVDPYHIPVGGAGQVAIVGLPNTGKSSIVAAVSHAPVKVADYPFTTTTPVAGMWPWQDAQIQLVDTPPVTGDHVDGGMVNLLRAASVIAIVADASSPDSLDQVDAVRRILAERQIELFDQPAADIPAGDGWRKPGLLVVTHADRVSPDEIAALKELLDTHLAVCPLDCPGRGGFDQLAENIWRLLHMLRAYTKRPGEKPDLAAPFTLPIGSTVEDLARAIHRDLPDKLKFARIWGTARHDGQQVHRTEPLKDRDVVEIHE